MATIKSRFGLGLFAIAILLSAPRPLRAEAPQVIKASPDNSEIDVDPSIRELRITFDQPMSTGGMSVVGGGETFPEVTGEPKWSKGDRVFILPIRLQANHDYWLSINSNRFTNFRNVAGEAATPYPLSFRTGSSGGSAPASESKEHRRALRLARKAVENYYSYRDRLELDWDGLFERAEKSIVRAKSPEEFASILGMMLSKAEDKHIWLTVGEQTFPSFVRPSVPNANFKQLPKLVPNWQMHGRRIATGKWDDGIAYIAIGSWNNAEIAEPIVNALREVAEAKALVIDVRGNGGGAEPLAQRVAGCFTQQRLLYAKHVYRDPKSSTGFGAVRERWLEPNLDWPHNESCVVVLTGPAVMSSCESFLLMMQATGAKLVGGRSQGSSGNPKPHDLRNGVTLFLPSWKDVEAVSSKA